MEFSAYRLSYFGKKQSGKITLLYLSWLAGSVIVAFFQVLLIALRIDEHFTASWQLLFGPFWIWAAISWHICLYQLYDANIQKSSTWKKAPENLRSITVYFGFPFIFTMIVSVFLIATRLDGISGTKVSLIFTLPWLVVIGIGIYEICLKGFSAYPAVIICSYITVALSIMAARLEGLNTWNWIGVLAVIFWIPDAVIIGLLIYAAYLRLGKTIRKKQKMKIIHDVAWYIILLFLFGLFVAWQTLLALNLEGVDFPQTHVQAPLLVMLFIILLLILPTIWATQLNKKRIAEDTVALNYKNKQKKVMTLLNDTFDALVKDKLKKCNTLGHDMEGLLLDNDILGNWFSDMTIKIGTEQFNVHRVVLALRAGVCDLLACLKTDIIPAKYSKKTCTYIISNDFGMSPGELKQLLLFVYSGKAEYKSNAQATIKRYSLLSDNISTTLEDDFGKALDTPKQYKKYADVFVIIQGKEYSFHKCFLCCRSEYFGAMFRVGMAEALDDVIELTDLDDKTTSYVFRAIYTSDIDVPSNDLVEFMELCHQYRLVDALQKIQEKLISFIDFQNVFDMANLAEMFMLDLLRAYCVYWLLIHYEYVSKFKTYNKLNDNIKQDVIKRRKQGAKWAKNGTSTQLEDAIKAAKKDSLVTSFRANPIRDSRNQPILETISDSHEQYDHLPGV